MDQYLLVPQVVHHPTVLAAYGEGRKWTFAGDAEVKSKFWGRSIELTPIGLLTLSFNDGDVYTWSKVRTLLSLMLKDTQIPHGTQQFTKKFLHLAILGFM